MCIVFHLLFFSSMSIAWNLLGCAYVSGLVFVVVFSEGVFVGCAVLMSVFLACGDTWHCEHTLFCVEIDKRHINFFII